MTNIVIVGINGKMGRLVYKYAGDFGFNVVCGIDKNFKGEFDCPVYKTFDQIREEVDLVVDFSTTKITYELCNFACSVRAKLFIGTTGQDVNSLAYIKSCAKKIAILKANNTSFGINLLLKICSNYLKNLDCDFNIIEKHHKLKADSPSGTAKEIKKALGNTCNIVSLREGNVVGEHTIDLAFEDEVLSIKHTAFSRDLFAKGALKCCQFLLTKEVGYYSSMDGLN